MLGHTHNLFISHDLHKQLKGFLINHSVMQADFFLFVFLSFFHSCWSGGKPHVWSEEVNRWTDKIEKIK